MTFRYQKVREKVITAALLVLMILSAPAARSAEILFGLAADPSARLMLASTSASYDPEQIVNLEQKADANPEDPAYRFLLGSLYARGRYFQEALEQYRKRDRAGRSSYRAMNNVGNVYLRTGRPEEAIKYYKNALGLRQDFLPAYYNSYLARKEMLQLREAEGVLREGQAIDSASLGRIIDDARARGPGEPIEALITRDEVFQRILGEGSGRTGIASSPDLRSFDRRRDLPASRPSRSCSSWGRATRRAARSAARPSATAARSATRCPTTAPSASRCPSPATRWLPRCAGRRPPSRTASARSGSACRGPRPSSCRGWDGCSTGARGREP